MSSIFTRALVPSFALAVSFLAANPSFSIDYNQCADLPKADRDNCLLSQSNLQELGGNGRRKADFFAGISLKHGMLMLGNDIENDGQFFSTLYEPSLSYKVKDEYLVSLLLPFSTFRDTTPQAGGLTSFGRPKLLGEIPVYTVENHQIDFSPSVRFPIYYFFDDYLENTQASSRYRVWRVFPKIAYKNQSMERYIFSVEWGVIYDSEYKLEVQGDVTQDVYQFPITNFFKVQAIQKFSRDEMGMSVSTYNSFNKSRLIILGDGQDKVIEVSRVDASSIDLFYNLKVGWKSNIKFELKKSLRLAENETWDMVFFDDLSEASWLRLGVDYSYLF